jgi:thioredoxin reductase
MYARSGCAAIIIGGGPAGLTATVVLQDRARENPKIETRYGVKVTAITGESQVEEVVLVAESGEKRCLK